MKTRDFWWFIRVFSCRLLENVEGAIHSSSCPIWQPNFKPQLPAHAIPRFGAKGGAPAAATGASVGTAAISNETGTVIKTEPPDVAQAEGMELEQSSDHPVGAKVPAQIKDEVPIDSAAYSADTDISPDLINEICQEIDVSKTSGGSGVSVFTLDSLHG